jgi:methylated-DNA-[protein]-cysteine S-methyltransferase
MFYDIFQSPIGKITIASDGSSITELHIEDDKYFLQIPADWQRDTSNSVLKQAKQELQEYFDKKRTKFSIPLSPEGTMFQKAVWKALEAIPSGTTVTYMQIAKQLKKPEAIRAVGSAVGRNPLCIFIPCHRVMGSDGKFHGYVAGIERKKNLLELEGMKFTAESNQLPLSL